MLLRRMKAWLVLRGCVWLLASARLWLPARIKPNRRISGDSLFGLGFALAQQLVQDDYTKRCYTNTADGKVADIQDEVDIMARYANHASTDGQTNGGGDQVATLRELH